MRCYAIVAGLWLGVAAVGAAEAPQMALWYKQPAPVQAQSLPWAPQGAKSGSAAPNELTWESQTLPVGNGRIGGTVYGGVSLDCVTLNEVSLWTGGPNRPANGAHYDYGPTAGQDAFGSYQPFADLYVQLEGSGEPTSYTRELNLARGIMSSSFTDKRLGRVERECYVSRPDDVFVYTVRQVRAGGEPLSANIALLPFHTVKYTQTGKDEICMRGTLANGEVFEGRMLVTAAGGAVSLENVAPRELEVSYAKNQPTYRAEGVPYIRVKGAKSFTVIISLATDYKMDAAANWKGEDPALHNEKTLTAARQTTPEKLRQAHLDDYRGFFNRMKLNLGKSDPKRAQLPTDERLKRYRESPNDPGLEELVYHYGRYLLIAGSQPGNLPANLQGIWNDKVHAPWASDYHNNINLQMCYWGAEVANLSECHLPLIHYISAMQEPMAEMTRREFGEHIRGWTSRISQNPWGGGGWTKWNPPVNAWYALHVWDHYLFTQDKDYLREVAYPLLKNICHFWEDRLKELGDHGEGLESDGQKLAVQHYPELRSIQKGALVSPGGWSHEWGPVEDGCMHDQQLVWELFDLTARAASILETDADWAAQLTEKKNRLVPNRIADGGYLQEWIIDRPNMVTGHRHTSHLIGVYPGSSISMQRTPELAKAARKSLELRGMSGDNRRSWTWPWRTALWARFHEAEKAHEMVRGYLSYNVLDNLFGNHPPMQMDGAYGMTGAISEMLVQSHAGCIELLPALPKAWANGSVQGLRARGNATIDMRWRQGRVVQFALYTDSPEPQPVTVMVNGRKQKATPKLRGQKSREE